jgi:hypothetical protein
VTLTKSAQQILTGMRQRTQFGESKEAAGSLDRVHRAEDAGQPPRIARMLLERDEILIELIEILRALDKEFLHKLFVTAHEGP